MGVQRRNVPHFKGLINAKVDPEAQGRDTTFTLCHAQLRKPILLLEMAKGVIFIFVNCMLVFCERGLIGLLSCPNLSLLTYITGSWITYII